MAFTDPRSLLYAPDKLSPDEAQRRRIVEWLPDLAEPAWDGLHPKDAFDKTYRLMKQGRAWIYKVTKLLPNPTIAFARRGNRVVVRGDGFRFNSRVTVYYHRIRRGTFPADTHPPIIYPVGATTTAKPEADDYLAYLRSQAAKAVLEKYGFNYLIRPTS